MTEYPGAVPFDRWPLVPPALAEVLPNVMWSRDRLHRLVVPAVDVLVDELRWQLDLPWWRDGNRVFAVSPNEVRRDPMRFAAQWQRTLDADLGYPIHLLDGPRPVVLDGVHRLLKAAVLDRPTIATHLVGRALFAERVVERTTDPRPA